MVFAFAGSKAVAGDATTVYLELSKTTTSPYDSNPIRGRATFIDATGNLATTVNGQAITNATLTISSATFAGDVRVSTAPYTTAVNNLTFSPAPLPIPLTAAWQEFALNYDDISQVANDIISATLKLGITSISADMPVNVTAPMANCYVVRSGGISNLPAVLGTIPPPQSDFLINRAAGDSVPIDVFAAYGVTNPNTQKVDNFIFTDQLPAGAQNVSVKGSSLVLVGGHVAATIQVKSLGLAGKLAAQTTDAGQLTAMQNAFTVGTQITWSASSTVIFPDVGTKCGDVDTNGIIDLCGYATFGGISNFTLDTSNTSTYYGLENTTLSSTFNTDTSNFFPGVIQTVNLVGLPITSITNNGATEGFLPSGQVSPLDAIYYLPDWTTKQSTFTVNSLTAGSPAVVYGALIGFDAFKNPAPFTTSAAATANFEILTTGGITATNISGIAPWSTYYTSTGQLNGKSSIANTFFLPFQSTAPVNSLYVGYVAGSQVPTAAISTINSESKAVTFAIKQNVAAMPTTQPFPTVNTQAGGKGITIGVTGTANEDSFNLTVVDQNGGMVMVNQTGSTTPATSVAIPVLNATSYTAQQKVSFFTTVADIPLHYIFTGASTNTIFAYKSAGATVSPADPHQFAPSLVTAGIPKAGAIIDTDVQDVSTCAFGVSDAFGNSYKFVVNGNTVDTIEDSTATAAVFLADGKTPFPGAYGSIDSNNVSANFQFNKVPAGEGTAILVVTAGSSSANMELDIRSLQQTILSTPFIPINGVTNTPVVVNFGDQNGALIAPVIGQSPSCTPGSYDVDITPKNGVTSASIESLTTLIPFASFTAKPTTGQITMTIAADGSEADAANTTLKLDFNADFEPPVIGTITAASCSISIACTDNRALNLAASPVVVRNSSGSDITSTLTRTNVGDGTTAGSIQFTGLPGVGTYSLEIVLKDKYNNSTPSTILTANVATCAQAACAGVYPTFGEPGNTLDVTITGTNTNFGAASVVSFSNSGITVNSNSVTVVSPTEIKANITISKTAAVGASDVTVTTGAEVVTCPQAFDIQIIPPGCVSVSPNVFNAGDTNKDVTITLQGVDLTKAASVTVSFGCTGVTVNSATVNSATVIAANISVADTAQDCTGDVTITGAGAAGIVCKGAFTVTGVVPPQCTITLSPSTVKTGIIFGREYTITATASAGCTFDATTTVTFSGNVTVVGTPVISGDTATAVIRTKPVILGGKGTNTVTVTTGAQTETATLTVTGLFF